MKLDHFLVFLGSGTAIPILVSILSSPRWPGGVRAILALLISIGAALWETRAQFIPGDWWTNATLVFAAVSLAYNGILKHVGLPALERGTADAWTEFWKRLPGSRTGSGSSWEESAGIVGRITKLDKLLADKVITKEQYQLRLEVLQNEALEKV